MAGGSPRTKLPPLKVAAGERSSGKEELHRQQQSHELLASPSSSGLPNVLSHVYGTRLDNVNHKMVTNRKMMNLNNDAAKHRMDTIVQSINRQIHDLDVKHKSRSLNLKFNLVNMNVYRKCLKKQRKLAGTKEDRKKFGLYGGVSYGSLKPSVKEVIEESHPRKRRMRKVEHCLQTGLQDGHLIDGDQATKKLLQIVEKPFERFVWSRAAKDPEKRQRFKHRRFSLERQNEIFFMLTKHPRMVAAEGTEITETILQNDNPTS